MNRPHIRTVQAFNVLLVAFAIMQTPCTFGQDPDYASELPRIAPTEPDKTWTGFKVAEPFEISLVAAEPLISSPVAIEWDSRGGMFVCEMKGYSENYDAKLSSIAYLSDRNGDGVYDHRADYVTRLAWPTGLFPYDGGLFVADAPDLLYFKDHDGDGYAESREVILTGFGTSNVQGLMNSLRWGLDNRIHIACSSNGGELRASNANAKAQAVRIQGRDISIDPKTLDWKMTSAAAQNGMCFDDWGHKFSCSNSDHIQQVMYEDEYIARNRYLRPLPSRRSIAIDGPQAEVYRASPVEPWRTLRTRLRVAGLAKGPIEGGGRAAGYFTGATGATLYRGDAWPKENLGQVIVGDVGSNLIHRKRLTQSGNEFFAHRIDEKSEFVTSTDIWFRPVQFANAPDGSLFVIDMYREVIEHPRSLPPEIKQHLDLNSGRERGRIYRIAPKNAQLRTSSDLSQLSESQLVELLAHPNAWHRETAARLIHENASQSIAEHLRAWLRQTPSALGKLHAIYTLQGLKQLDEPTLLLVIADEHPQVRRHAIKLSESFPNSRKVFDAITTCLNDPNDEVRYQLAFSLGEFPSELRIQPLMNLLRHSATDPWIVFACLSSLDVSDYEHPKQLSLLRQSFPAPPESLQQPIDELLARLSLAQPNAADPLQRIAMDDAPGVDTQAPLKEALIDRYRPALEMRADENQGRALFKQHCSVCHLLHGVGHELGPNLAAMRNRGAEAVLTAVLDPNREVNPQYMAHQLLMNDGRVITGIISEEGANSLTLKRAENAVDTFLKIDVDAIKNSGQSLMPEGFENTLDLQAMADLVCYLMKPI